MLDAEFINPLDEFLHKSLRACNLFIEPCRTGPVRLLQRQQPKINGDQA